MCKVNLDRRTLLAAGIVAEIYSQRYDTRLEKSGHLKYWGWSPILDTAENILCDSRETVLEAPNDGNLG